MNKQNVVKTDHLIIEPLSDSEMEHLIAKELDTDMKQAYSEMLAGCKQNPEQRIWHAVWNMQINDVTGKSVGDLSFKGLDSNGIVEIGYGIKEEYEGQGYMTEAVTAMARWASEQIGVKYVEAETDPDNKASQRVLEKSGFILNGKIGVEGPRYVWKKVYLN
ncbi:GNAT family N-acetyltransferase [Anaeromicropila herbilytica]|uniref:N-acetyltransferase n=1 Tax=Anaeromicropila herbilytica TaxID=2785025 RepID=A0A7R7IEB9_9FIRM|nr:GNAT family N-acetyltransferase [Anaeromicropila herbilytica]BCN30953.1 N-acetyltransferase [Anaeromicropila herbilytica]